MTGIYFNSHNNLALTPAKPKEIFKNFMGKEYDSNTENQIEKVIYHLFKDSKNLTKPLNIDLKIIDLNPKTQQSLLTICLFLASAKGQTEKIKNFNEKLKNLEEIHNLTPLSSIPTFDKTEEKPSFFTALRVTGFALFLIIGSVLYNTTKRYYISDLNEFYHRSEEAQLVGFFANQRYMSCNAFRDIIPLIKETYREYVVSNTLNFLSSKPNQENCDDPVSLAVDAQKWLKPDAWQKIIDKTDSDFRYEVLDKRIQQFIENKEFSKALEFTISKDWNREKNLEQIALISDKPEIWKKALKNLANTSHAHVNKFNQLMENHNHYEEVLDLAIFLTSNGHSLTPWEDRVRERIALRPFYNQEKLTPERQLELLPFLYTGLTHNEYKTFISRIPDSHRTKAYVQEANRLYQESNRLKKEDGDYRNVNKIYKEAFDLAYVEMQKHCSPDEWEELVLQLKEELRDSIISFKVSELTKEKHFGEALNFIHLTDNNLWRFQDEIKKIVLGCDDPEVWKKALPYINYDLKVIIDKIEQLRKEDKLEDALFAATFLHRPGRFSDLFYKHECEIRDTLVTRYLARNDYDEALKMALSLPDNTYFYSANRKEALLRIIKSCKQPEMWDKIFNLEPRMRWSYDVLEVLVGLHINENKLDEALKMALLIPAKHIENYYEQWKEFVIPESEIQKLDRSIIEFYYKTAINVVLLIMKKNTEENPQLPKIWTDAFNDKLVNAVEYQINEELGWGKNPTRALDLALILPPACQGCVENRKLALEKILESNPPLFIRERALKYIEIEEKALNKAL